MWDDGQSVAILDSYDGYEGCGGGLQPTGVDDRSFNQQWGERHGANRYNLRFQREPGYTLYGRVADHLAELQKAKAQLNTVFVGDVRAEPLLAHY